MTFRIFDYLRRVVESVFKPGFRLHHKLVVVAGSSRHTINPFNEVVEEAVIARRDDNNFATETNPRPFDTIPGPKPSLPLIGTSWIYFPCVGYYKSMKLHEANLDKYRRYGPIMKEEYQPGFPSVMVFHPNDIKEVFLREGACPSRPVSSFVIKHRLSDPARYPNVGLANMMGQEWLELRSQLAPILLSKELKKRFIGSQNRISTRLVDYIFKYSSSPSKKNDLNQSDDNSIIIPNIQEVFYRFSMESIVNLCTNKELGCLDSTGSRSSEMAMSDGELIFQAGMNFFKAQHELYYGSGWWKYYDTKPFRQLRDSQNAIHDITSKYIDIALSNLKEAHNEDSRSSLLGTLHGMNRFNDLEIKSIVVDFIGGGIYTVANTLTMALFLLASNPDTQDQLYEEINKVFNHQLNEQDLDIDLEKLEQMRYLKYCLKESNRLLPIIPGVARTLHKDTVLSNYLVPKNTLVFCNSMVACRLPQFFENPDSYIPSRWERSSKQKGDINFSVLPFGHGVRKCVGRNFAELEIYVALAKIVKSFRLQTVNPDENANSLDLSFKFIVVPTKPVGIKFIPRKFKEI